MIVNQHPILVRAANPTLDEGLVFARYLDEAAEGFFRFMLGRNVADIIATAYTQPDHDLSYQNVIVAERDNVIVGMASGYTAEQHRGYSDQPLKQAAGAHVVRMMAVATLCAPLLRFLESHANGDFYLQSIAVDKEHRGEGVGSTLIDAIEDRARTCGAARLALDVSAGNEGARSLYGRRGMTVESMWPTRFFLPRFVVRMTKPL
jgi:ribosomal protein S18 acetylase RimI-like enzyme